MRRFSPLLDVSCAIFANICSAKGRSAMRRVEANAVPARLNASWRCRRKGGFRRGLGNLFRQNSKNFRIIF